MQWVTEFDWKFSPSKSGTPSKDLADISVDLGPERGPLAGNDDVSFQGHLGPGKGDLEGFASLFLSFSLPNLLKSKRFIIPSLLSPTFSVCCLFPCNGAFSPHSSDSPWRGEHHRAFIIEPKKLHHQHGNHGEKLQGTKEGHTLLHCHSKRKRWKEGRPLVRWCLV